MRLIYALPLFFASIANAQNFDNSVNWKDVSSTPAIEEQNFVPANTNMQENFVQNELVNFDFLNQTIDERVFYNFKAKLRVLNKYTDEIKDYSLKPQEVIDLKKFKILVKSCAITPINHVDNQLAFIEVYRKEIPVFKGWMSNIHKNINFPELSELYLNLISCDKTELASEEVEINGVQEIGETTLIKPIFVN